MADFLQAYNKTMSHEGGYSFDPNDAGGETYKGVSRRAHPNWFGWRVVDEAKKFKDFPNNLTKNKDLQDLILEFYKDKFWDILNLDHYSQEISEELFDTCVNVGVFRAVTFLQSTINLLNRNGQKYDDIVIDGKFGPNTEKYFNLCLQTNTEKLILNVLNGYQIKHYITLMEKNPTQEIYIGWFNRVEITRS